MPGTDRYAGKTDEERILAALQVPSTQNEKKGAPFKIEIHWGKDRSILKPCTGAVLIWESGKRFHGGGDEKMYWCGHDDCKMPIRTQFFAQFHVVCPHCGKECFLDGDSKTSFLTAKNLSSGERGDLAKLPTVFGERFFKSPVKKVAELLADEFRKLGSQADIYMKFHRTDIRCRDIENVGEKGIQYEKAREARKDGLLIYPLARIMKDVSAGGDLVKRILAMCTA